MNIKSLKTIIISFVLLFCIFILTGCNSNKKDEIIYTKVEIGDVDYELKDEYSIENKYVRQWIIENKETQGLYTKMLDDTTYVLYSMGEKTHYGYGFSSVSVYKEKEVSPIQLDIITNESNMINAKEEINYPYVVIQIKGNIKDEFKENIIALKEDEILDNDKTQTTDNVNGEVNEIK